MEWNIDELLPSVAALGYNAQWPGPTIRATEGDKLRVKFKNNLPETDGRPLPWRRSSPTSSRTASRS